MRYTLTFTEDVFEGLAQVVFASPEREGAAYVLCGTSTTDDETRLLAREVVPVAEEHYRAREKDHLSIASDSYVSIAKRAKLGKQAVLFVHSHPEGCNDFSPQDDHEHSKLMAFISSRATDIVHGEMVLSSTMAFRGRVWVQGTWSDITRIRRIGRRFRFTDDLAGEAPPSELYDRQVNAFGRDIQLLLGRLHVGVVGAGGTGSAVIEQLTRLGVGTISVFDGDALDASNVTRVYASKIDDEGKMKTVIQQEAVHGIGLQTEIRSFPNHITKEATAKELRNCDVIFGCTDKQAPRGILVQVASRYLIPCIDMAVKVDSEDGIIRGIWGRATTFFPGEACLFCRGTIDSETIRAEGLPPEQRDREIQEGYIRGVATDEPAVIMFTTAVASQAISELLHRLTGFMGEDRHSTETIMFFHESRVRTNREMPAADCVCQHRGIWGRGDSRDYLGLFWG